MKRLCRIAGLFASAAAWATAASLAAAQPPQGAPPSTKNGVHVCLQCHNQPPANLVLQTPHAVKADARTPFAQQQCETCHGASAAHVEVAGTPVAVVYKGPKRSPVAQRNAVCLSCHEAGLRTYWTGSQHESRGVACNDCHTIHARIQPVLSKATQAQVCFTCHKTQRAQIRRISAHPLAVTSLASTAKMSCSDCHNPHGSTGPSLMKRDTINDTCYTCHMEKRGPFVHNHEPVSENCANCHNPHGTIAENLLKARPPFLCQECHTPHGPIVPQVVGQGQTGTINGVPATVTATSSGKAPLNFIMARGCTNCHTEVHGTNNPSTANPTPQFNFR